MATPTTRRKRAPQTVFLIDAPVYIFRAYFSLPASMVDTKGRPFNAVYGFGQFLCSLLERECPTHVAAAFDESLTTSLRNQWYADYKANRELPPRELEEQFAQCKRLTRAMGVRTYASGHYEADDLIATVARRARDAGMRTMIVSRDKDLAQLVGPGDRWWDGLDGPRLSARGVKVRFGVAPAQIADYLALTGDAVDNIPGVPGIGPAAARVLLGRYRTLEKIYDNLGRVADLEVRGARRIAELLKRNRDAAFLSQRLARLHTNSRLRCEPSDLVWRGPNRRSLLALFRELGIGARLTQRCLALRGSVA
ncbi:MAG: hypothetical protein JSW10_10465 [Pseudomonadota bacterium]|nr:MAG: hypothetical protein JSW10_10465 [Pseudomonadota bacterium]